MFRSRRSFAWSLVLALLCASFVTAQKQPTVAHAAGAIINVNTTLDLFGDGAPGSPTGPDQGGCFSNSANPLLCSLRQAINDANRTPASTINFRIDSNESTDESIVIPGPPPTIIGRQTWRIQPDPLPLPAITAAGTLINGLSQAEFIGGNPNVSGPEIIIDGVNVFNYGGLVITGANVEIRAIGLINFTGSSSPSDNSLKGVGIEVAATASGAKLQGNYIGTLGYGPAKNNDFGIWLRGNNNTVGGNSSTLTYAFNVISGNNKDGIILEGSGNAIRGNFIGTDDTGLIAVPNGGNGIQLRFGTATNNIIGTDPNDLVLQRVYRNVISGNGGYGILINEAGNNGIYGNRIGVSQAGTTKIANAGGGIRLAGALFASANNTIGGISEYSRNYIAGNGGPGIYFNGFLVANNKVSNNYIGLGLDGSVPAGAGSNNTVGILFDDGAHDNTIGGPIDGAIGVISSIAQHNVISGNSGDGIRLQGRQSGNVNLITNKTTISGNYIGTSPGGLFAIPNTGNGITLNTKVQNTTIGSTTDSKFSNRIGYNGANGIQLTGTEVKITRINKNTILRNTLNGIRMTNANDTLITSNAPAAYNQIIENGNSGIVATNSVSTTVRYNALLRNTQQGIGVDGALSTTFKVLSNDIISNTLNGINFANGSNATIDKNNLKLNKANGVIVQGQAISVTITNSQIYSNTLNGVVVKDGGAIGTQKVKILDNSMTGNAVGGDKKGILLSPTAAHPGGLVTNPNHDIDPPYLMHINQLGDMSGKIRLLPDSPAVSGCAQPCTIQIFATNPQTLDGQGRDKVNTAVSITPDNNDPNIGNFSASVGLVPAQLALTATDKDGNTSEFAVFTTTFGLDIQPPRSGSAVPGQVVTYTHRITNTGTVDFTNIQFTAFSKLGWPYKLAPANPIALLSGESKPVTLTLTLPTGSDARVRAGLVEETRLTISASTANPSMVTTASVTDTTTVLPKFILDASFKLGRQGAGTPGTVIDYTRMLTNTGNITGTVTLGAITDLGWTTLITPTLVQLPPGKAIGVNSSVAIPQGATAGTVAKTTLTFNGTPDSGTPDAQQLVITDTTTVLLTPKATMVFNQQAQGNAGKTVVFCHTVTNLSNGAATFSLTGVSSLGSKITFISDTPGRQLVDGHTFTVGITDSDKFFNFCAHVLIDPYAAKGQQDLVAIGLIDDQGVVVGGASVRDLIDIVGGLVLPRIYMPDMRR
jgi:hypothetical protein